MALASVLAYFASFIPGSRLVDGGDCLAMAKQMFQVTTGITALAGGGQTGATALNIGLNRVDTAGAGGTDSVMLPPAIPGTNVDVYNNTSNSIQVFGQGPNMGGLAAGDTIASNSSNTQQATATGVSQASAKVGTYYCFAVGQWKQLVSA